MSTHKQAFTVKSYETNHKGLFKPYAFLNHAQEIAGNHASELGFGYDSLNESGIAWVLSRIHVIYLRHPLWREELTLKTWHKGCDKLFGYRDYTLADQSGQTVVNATSSWLIIDKQTRRLLRAESVLGNNFPGTISDNAINKPAERLQTPPDMVFAHKRVVSISDIDINQHTNNAKYLEWALDALRENVSKNLSIKEFLINFNSESVLGDEIDIYCTCSPSIFIEGTRDGKSVFQVQIIT